jgi:ATP-dependent protease Clp ATPase subunit
VAVYNHYKRVQMAGQTDSEVELAKSNILPWARPAAANAAAQTLARS